MTLAEILDRVMGPFGALVLAVGALVWAVRTWRADVKRLTELVQSEQEARIADAKQNTEALQALNDRAHESIRKLWEMWRASTGKTVPPPNASDKPGR